MAEGIDDSSHSPAVLSAIGDFAVAPAAMAWQNTESGSSTTSSIRLAVPPMAHGTKRSVLDPVAAIQNDAAPTASCATMAGHCVRISIEDQNRKPIRWRTVALFAFLLFQGKCCPDKEPDERDYIDDTPTIRSGSGSRCGTGGGFGRRGRRPRN
jgi:hypothetical protein